MALLVVLLLSSVHFAGAGNSFVVCCLLVVVCFAVPPFGSGSGSRLASRQILRLVDKPSLELLTHIPAVFDVFGCVHNAVF